MKGLVAVRVYRRSRYRISLALLPPSDLRIDCGPRDRRSLLAMARVEEDLRFSPEPFAMFGSAA